MEKRQLLTAAVNSQRRRTWKLASVRIFSILIAVGLLWYLKQDQRRQWLPFENLSFKSKDDFNWSQVSNDFVHVLQLHLISTGQSLRKSHLYTMF